VLRAALITFMSALLMTRAVVGSVLASASGVWGLELRVNSLRSGWDPQKRGESSYWKHEPDNQRNWSQKQQGCGWGESSHVTAEWKNGACPARDDSAWHDSDWKDGGYPPTASHHRRWFSAEDRPQDELWTARDNSWCEGAARGGTNVEGGAGGVPLTGEPDSRGSSGSPPGSKATSADDPEWSGGGAYATCGTSWAIARVEQLDTHSAAGSAADLPWPPGPPAHAAAYEPSLVPKTSALSEDTYSASVEDWQRLRESLQIIKAVQAFAENTLDQCDFSARDGAFSWFEGRYGVLQCKLEKELQLSQGAAWFLNLAFHQETHRTARIWALNTARTWVETGLARIRNSGEDPIQGGTYRGPSRPVPPTFTHEMPRDLLRSCVPLEGGVAVAVNRLLAQAAAQKTKLGETWAAVSQAWEAFVALAGPGGVGSADSADSAGLRKSRALSMSGSGNDVGIRPFGSSESDFVHAGSDLDCAVSLMPSVNKTQFMEELRDHFLSFSGSPASATSGGLRVFELREDSTNSQWPAFTLWCTTTQQSVDVGVDKWAEIADTELLQTYSREYPRVRQLGAIAKTWAKHRGLTEKVGSDGGGGGSTRALLSSFDIVLLVISWAQARGLVPVLDVNQGCDPGDLSRGIQNTQRESLAILACDWHDWLSYFMWYLEHPFAVCIRRGPRVELEALKLGDGPASGGQQGGSSVNARLDQCIEKAARSEWKLVIAEPRRLDRLRTVYDPARTMKIHDEIETALATSLSDAVKRVLLNYFFCFFAFVVGSSHSVFVLFPVSGRSFSV